MYEAIPLPTRDLFRGIYFSRTVPINDNMQRALNTLVQLNATMVRLYVSSDARSVRHRHRIISGGTWTRKSATGCTASRDIDSYFRSSIIYPPPPGWLSRGEFMKTV